MFSPAKFSLLLFSLLFFSLSACTPREIQVTLADSGQKLPHPKFTAKDYSREGQIPDFSHIRVWDVTEECELPGCPIMWHVVLSGNTGSPSIHYGILPSFGSNTIISPKRLKTGRIYLLTLGQEEHNPEKLEGELRFQVTEDGRVEPAAASAD